MSDQQKITDGMKNLEVAEGNIKKIAGTVNVNLGPMTPHNIMQFRILNTAIFPIIYNDKFYYDASKAGDFAKFAYFNDLVVGAIYCRLLDVENEKALYIMTLGVLAPYRKYGIGNYLIDYVYKLCEDNKDIKRIWLHVKTDNEVALNFYSRHGFQKGELMKDYYQHTPADAYVLLKQYRQ